MHIAKVFESDGYQMVDLPPEFHFVGDEVEIFRRGDEVILCEKPQEKPPLGRPEGNSPEARGTMTMPGLSVENWAA
ncbi:MAG TPA: hypothetical protein VF601_02930 [Beijerinckiaceae bacterium]|jgi:hypothetical protein